MSGPKIVVCLRDVAAMRRRRTLQEAEKVGPGGVIHPSPKRQKGKFVGIINEVADLWHIDLVQAPFYPVQASLKKIS